MDIAISSLLVWLFVRQALGSDLPAIHESMGSRHACEQYPSQIHWISEKTSALVIGKSEEPIKVCRLKFGLATNKLDARLRLSFDFMYNQACGVFLQINESVTSDFTSSETNKEMLMSGCYNRNPGPLYAQPKNFILISLVKEYDRLEAYNFRLNISMAEHLPARGPELHVVIIVGFVLFTVVALVAILLFKYVTRLSYHWHDRRIEEAATMRAINIYSSQDHLQRPDHTYVIRSAASQQSVKNTPEGSQTTFVQSDGQMGRFLRVNGASSSMRDLTTRVPSFKKPEGRMKAVDDSSTYKPASRDVESLSAPGAGNDFSDTTSLGGCDIPPSYEEALRMPLAADLDRDMDTESLDVAVGGRLELAGLNNDSGGGDTENSAETSADKENKTSET